MLQRNLSSDTWSTSSPSFFTDLGVCRAVSFKNSHSPVLTAAGGTLLNYINPEALPVPDGVCLGQQHIHPEASWHWPFQT